MAGWHRRLNETTGDREGWGPAAHAVAQSTRVLYNNWAQETRDSVGKRPRPAAPPEEAAGPLPEPFKELGPKATKKTGSDKRRGGGGPGTVTLEEGTSKIAYAPQPRPPPCEGRRERGGRGDKGAKDGGSGKNGRRGARRRAWRGKLGPGHTLR